MIFSTEVIGIYNRNYQNLFNHAKVMNCSVKESSSLMQHPLEDGSTITDHIVKNSTEIEIILSINVFEYRSIYHDIAQSHLKGELFCINTKVGAFYNMIIESMPHEEPPEKYDIISMNLHFKEVRIVQIQYQTMTCFQVVNVNDQSTIDRGDIKPKKSNTLFKSLTELY